MFPMIREQREAERKRLREAGAYSNTPVLLAFAWVCGIFILAKLLNAGYFPRLARLLGACR
jgi:hypothetical protein